MKPAAFLLAAICVFSPVSPVTTQGQTAPAPAASPTPTVPPDSPKFGVYPIAYREIITRWLSDRLLDPSSAKVEFNEPLAGEIKTKTGRASGYSVEFRVNSRNKFGMFTGFQKFRVLIRNGEIIWADRVRG
ncbi:MAG TPA: hypothetical protein VK993_05165 [Chthoniobacterales bacterium]|nr:hypothetical protein [Chthoniobacterales bacterium]